MGVTADQKNEETPLYDLLVVGGGVNGTGIARDAAGRGLSVLLCEQDDLARYTSSSSTKLIHGGLRYLEHYDFKLVRHSLLEREVLLNSAPHIIWPLRFVLPHHPVLRSRWLIRMGLFLYDWLAKRKRIPGSKSIDLGRHIAGKALQSTYTKGFEYSDCWVQDSRLTVLNAVDARERGATILTRTKCVNLTREDKLWAAVLEPKGEASRKVIRAKAVVNAAGPWAEQVAKLDADSHTTHRIRLVKGSHVVVPALFEHDYAYIFQNSDERILFAIPYEQHYTLLGTTDVEVDHYPDKAQISDEEVGYICRHASEYFEQEIVASDVMHAYCGVRPLFDDAAENASETTREYVLHVNDDGPTIVSVYGGKLTTYRKLSEQVVNQIAKNQTVSSGPWTAEAKLPGGDIPNGNFDHFLYQCQQKYPWCNAELISRLAREYGTRIDDVLAGKSEMADLGLHFGAGLYQAEVSFLMKYEWANDADDIIWRRTKTGLHGGEDLRVQLAKWLKSSAMGAGKASSVVS